MIDVSGTGGSGAALDLVGDAAGNAIAIWNHETSIRVAHFSAVTKAWGAPVTLLSGSVYTPHIDIAITPGGDAIVVSDESSGSKGIYATWYRAGSATWSAPVTIASAGQSPQVAVDSQGNATAIWQASGPVFQLRAARYTAATGVWSAAVNVTPLAASAPGVVMDGSGHATAVFWMSAAGGPAMHTSRSSADGSSWSSAEALSVGDESFPSGVNPPPALTVNAAGNVFVVWRGVAGIRAARYVAANGAWSDTHTFVDAGFEHRVEVVVDDAGNATAAWVGQGIISATYSTSSETWSTPEPIPGSLYGRSPGLTVDGTGTITAVWSGHDPATGMRVAASRRVSGQPWTAAVTLDQHGGGRGFAAASRVGDVTTLSGNLRSTRWASTGAEVVAAPTALTVTTFRLWNMKAAQGEPLTISWSAPQTGLPVTGYRLEAGTSPGSTDLAVVDVGMATQLVTTVPAVPTVIVRVRAMSGAAVGPPSAEQGFFVHGFCDPISAPSALTHTVLGSTVTFTWSPGSAGVTYPYVLEAGTATGLANLVSQDIGSATRYSATAPPGTYYVRVRAKSACGSSEPSNEVVVTIGGGTAPGAPVLNTPVVSGNTVSLSWSAGSGGAPTGYTLTASVTPAGAPVATVPLSGASASFPGVPRGTYYLLLTASNAAGMSPPSAQVTLHVP